MYLKSSMVAIGGIAVLLLLAEGAFLLGESESAVVVLMRIDTALEHLGARDSTTPAEEPTYAEELFENFDEDLDGGLTSDEVPAHLYVRLQQCDIDGSGFLTLSELENVAPLSAEHYSAEYGDALETYDPNVTLYEQLDVDRDDALTPDETPEILWASIQAADLNGDGRVTRQELATLPTIMSAR
ncbi:MAG: hypothetical protein ACLFWB_07280 [Armatimonadota bacterium]